MYVSWASGNGTVYIAGTDEGAADSRTTTPIKFSGPRTAALPGPIRTLAARLPGLAYKLAATTRTSPACFLTRLVFGGMKVGANLLP